MADRKKGPPVANDEGLYRAIIAPSHWSAQRAGPSTAAFKKEVFSASIKSMTTPVAVRDKWNADCGVVEFNSGKARKIDYDARHEPEHGDDSHANVYNGGAVTRARARLMVDICKVVIEPSFENGSS